MSKSRAERAAEWTRSGPARRCAPTVLGHVLSHPSRMGLERRFSSLNAVIRDTPHPPGLTSKRSTISKTSAIFSEGTPTTTRSCNS
jgi:hypothetical protein